MITANWYNSIDILLFVEFLMELIKAPVMQTGNEYRNRFLQLIKEEEALPECGKMMQCALPLRLQLRFQSIYCLQFKVIHYYDDGSPFPLLLARYNRRRVVNAGVVTYARIRPTVGRNSLLFWP